MLLGVNALMSPMNTEMKLKTVPARWLLGVATAGGTVRNVWRTSEPLLMIVTACCGVLILVVGVLSRRLPSLLVTRAFFCYARWYYTACATVDMLGCGYEKCYRCGWCVVWF